jgi:hypothetical protein
MGRGATLAKALAEPVRVRILDVVAPAPVGLLLGRPAALEELTAWLT